MQLHDLAGKRVKPLAKIAKPKRVRRSKWTRYAVVVESDLAEAFRKTCEDRGRKQNWVVSGLMRGYIGEPARKGVKKKRVELSSSVS